MNLPGWQGKREWQGLDAGKLAAGKMAADSFGVI